MKQSPTHSPVRTLQLLDMTACTIIKNLRLVDVNDNLERRLNTVVLNLAVLKGLNIGLSREPQDVECVVACQCKQLSAL